MKEDSEATLSPSDRTTVEFARNLIELRGGLSHKYSRNYWRFSTKAELCGQVEAGERFVQGIKDAFAKGGEVSISFLPGPGKWNEELAAKLIADAQQGDADAHQVLREVAIEYLRTRIPLSNELADYVAACLEQTNSSKAQSDKKAQSHKTDYRDWILALTVDDIVRHFKLKHTRNDATEKHCGCSIVALAAELSENTVQNAWHRYRGIADQRTATNYVPQAMVTVTYDAPREYLMRPPCVAGSDGTQEHFLVRFPRVGSIEAMPRPKPRPKDLLQKSV